MKNRILACFTVILLVILFSACHSNLKDRWVYIKGKGNHPQGENRGPDFSRFFMNLSLIDKSDPLSGSFFQLNNFGKYNLRMSTTYSEGKWSFLNDSILQLVSSTSDTIPVRLESCKNDTLKIRFLTGHNFANYLNYLSNDTTVTYLSDTIRYFKSANPYSYRCNKWAVKATHKLSEKEIREKLLNYIDYLIAVLKDPRENSGYLEKITDPVNVASNGISLKVKDRVDPEWRNLFYDEDGYTKAYNMLQSTFQCDVKLLDTKDFVELDVDILKQIRTIITSGKPCKPRFQ